MWTILLIFAAVSIMMFAERKIEIGRAPSRRRLQPFPAP